MRKAPRGAGEVVRKRSSVVCIAAHAGAWTGMQRFCFSPTMLACRELFDLCMVLNGHDEPMIAAINASVSPELLVVRENTGLDQGAFNAAIQHATGYDTYVLLHYDHWFADPDWFPTLHRLLYDSDCDVIGNLVQPSTFVMPIEYYVVTGVLGYRDLKPELFDGFLQGGAGMYKADAIQCLLDQGGIPFGKANDRPIAAVCERLMSFILMDHGMTLGQIPPGYEKYLRHAEH